MSDLERITELQETIRKLDSLNKNDILDLSQQLEITSSSKRRDHLAHVIMKYLETMAKYERFEVIQTISKMVHCYLSQSGKQNFRALLSEKRQSLNVFKKSIFYEFLYTKEKVFIKEGIDLDADGKPMLLVERMKVQLNDYDRELLREKKYKLAFMCERIGGDSFIEYPHPFKIYVNNIDVKASTKRISKSNTSVMPVDVTSFLNLKPTISKDNRATPINYISIKTHGSDSAAYNLYLNMIEYKSIERLLDFIKKQPIISESVDLKLLKDNQIEDVSTSKEILSLKCPISGARMRVPIRATRCQHIQCFDAESYILLQRKNSTLLCPVCNSKIKFKYLAVDEFFKKIIDDEATQKYEHIEIDINGSWKPKKDIDDKLNPTKITAFNKAPTHQTPDKISEVKVKNEIIVNDINATLVLTDEGEFVVNNKRKGSFDYHKNKKQKVNHEQEIKEPKQNNSPVTNDIPVFHEVIELLTDDEEEATTENTKITTNHNVSNGSDTHNDVSRKQKNTGNSGSDGTSVGQFIAPPLNKSNTQAHDSAPKSSGPEVASKPFSESTEQNEISEPHYSRSESLDRVEFSLLKQIEDRITVASKFKSTMDMLMRDITSMNLKILPPDSKFSGFVFDYLDKELQRSMSPESIKAQTNLVANISSLRSKYLKCNQVLASLNKDLDNFRKLKHTPTTHEENNQMEIPSSLNSSLQFSPQDHQTIHPLNDLNHVVSNLVPNSTMPNNTNKQQFTNEQPPLDFNTSRHVPDSARPSQTTNTQYNAPNATVHSATCSADSNSATLEEMRELIANAQLVFFHSNNIYSNYISSDIQRVELILNEAAELRKQNKELPLILIHEYKNASKAINSFLWLTLEMNCKAMQNIVHREMNFLKSLDLYLKRYKQIVESKNSQLSSRIDLKTFANAVSYRVSTLLWQKLNDTIQCLKQSSYIEANKKFTNIFLSVIDELKPYFADINKAPFFELSILRLSKSLSPLNHKFPVKFDSPSNINTLTTLIKMIDDFDLNILPNLRSISHPNLPSNSASNSTPQSLFFNPSSGSGKPEYISTNVNTNTQILRRNVNSDIMSQGHSKNLPVQPELSSQSNKSNTISPDIQQTLNSSARYQSPQAHQILQKVSYNSNHNPSNIRPSMISNPNVPLPHEVFPANFNAMNTSSVIYDGGMGTEQSRTTQVQQRFEQERLARERLEEQRTEQEKSLKQRIENERLTRERLEQQKIEQQRLARERMEQQKVENERLARERLEQQRLEQQRLEQQRLEQQRIEQQRIEHERLARERLEQQRIEHERLARERLEQQRIEKQILEKERLEKERLEKERLEKERLEKERLEKERLEKERLEKERLEKERLEKERLEKERLEKEKLGEANINKDTSKNFSTSVFQSAPKEEFRKLHTFTFKAAEESRIERKGSDLEKRGTGREELLATQKELAAQRKRLREEQAKKQVLAEAVSTQPVNDSSSHDDTDIDELFEELDDNVENTAKFDGKSVHPVHATTKKSKSIENDGTNRPLSLKTSTEISKIDKTKGIDGNILKIIAENQRRLNTKYSSIHNILESQPEFKNTSVKQLVLERIEKAKAERKQNNENSREKGTPVERLASLNKRPNTGAGLLGYSIPNSMKSFFNNQKKDQNAFPKSGSPVLNSKKSLNEMDDDDPIVNKRRDRSLVLPPDSGEITNNNTNYNGEYIDLTIED